MLLDSHPRSLSDGSYSGKIREHTGGPWGTLAHVDAARVARALGVKDLQALCRGTLLMAEIMLKIVKLEEMSIARGAGFKKKKSKQLDPGSQGSLVHRAEPKRFLPRRKHSTRLSL